MKAIYKGTLYDLGDNLNVVELTDPETGVNLTVSWHDPDLIVDPTDDEINNILPDYDGIETAPSEKLAEGFDGRMKIAVPLDQIVGCNVRGRLLYIYDLIKEDKGNEAGNEIWKLLEFFPVEKH